MSGKRVLVDGLGGKAEMEILGLGIDYTTGDPLVGSMDEQDFATRIRDGLGRNAKEIQRLSRATAVGSTFRGGLEMERARTVDLGDPRAAGWTFLLNASDPGYEDLVETIAPLAEHRGMEDPSEPLLFHSESPDEWFDWLLENYSSLETENVPYYLLILGGPEQVPFHFQSLLGSAASVGRLTFDSIDHLQTYVEKLLRLEEAPEPVVNREAIVFGPDGGPRDATYFSRRYMAEPMAEHVRTKHNLTTRKLMGEDATKGNLEAALSGSKPALIYTASHGLGAPAEDLVIQKRFNGAIYCQQRDDEPIRDLLFAGEDVPEDGPFLEGSAFYQFACFGCGTPAESDFMHWIGSPGLNSKEDFVAALPKRLLAHPRGPITFIGHVDTAWLHGFDDPNHPHLLERWHPRIAPYVNAVDTLLRVQPAGPAMAEMCKRYDIANAQLTGLVDRLKRGRLKEDDEFRARLASAFITRSDAQNYMILGDPAARLRIPSA